MCSGYPVFPELAPGGTERGWPTALPLTRGPARGGVSAEVETAKEGFLDILREYIVEKQNKDRKTKPKASRLSCWCLALSYAGFFWSFQRASGVVFVTLESVPLNCRSRASGKAACRKLYTVGSFSHVAVGTSTLQFTTFPCSSMSLGFIMKET